MTPRHSPEPQAVWSFNACKLGNECPHCAAGRPEAPETAGNPADRSSGTWEIELSEQRFALPPTYHRPVYLETLRPPGWFCAACWDESQLTQWPCMVADRHALYVSRAISEEREESVRTHAALERANRLKPAEMANEWTWRQNAFIGVRDASPDRATAAANAGRCRVANPGDAQNIAIVRRTVTPWVDADQDTGDSRA